MSSARFRLTAWFATFVLAAALRPQPAAADYPQTVLPEPSSWVWVVSFSPDGRTLASAHIDYTIKLWDSSTGLKLRTLRHGVRSISFSPDSRILAGADLSTKIWDIDTGKELRTFPRDHLFVSFSPNGQTFVTGSYFDKTIKIRLRDTKTGRILHTFTGNSERVVSASFSPDGRILATRSGSQTIKLWKVATGRELRVLSGHTDSVKSISFSPDGRILASASNDYTLKLWDVPSGKELRTLYGHSDQVNAVSFSPDGTTLVSASHDNMVKLWDTETGWELRTFYGHSSLVLSVSFSPDGRILASAGSDETVKLWDVATGRELRTLTGYSDKVWDVAFSPDGQIIASASLDETVKLWDVSTGRNLHILYGHSQGVYSVSFSPDGTILASGSEDDTIKLWDVATGMELITLRGHTNSVSSLAFSPDGRTLAAENGDSVMLWDTATSRELRSISSGHKYGIESLAYSPDGKLLATVGADKAVKLWDATTSNELHTLIGHSKGVNSVAFSPDSRKIASASWDETIMLWDVDTGKVLRKMTGHSGSVTAVAFSPGGRLLASASHDKKVILWDMTSGRKRHILNGHSQWVTSVSFSPDGRTLTSVSYDGTTRLWEVSSGRELIRMIGFRNGEWLSLTPEGYYTISTNGDQHLNVRTGPGLFDVEPMSAKWRKLFHRPDKVREVLRGIVQKDRDPPMLEITEPARARGVARTESGKTVTVAGVATDASGVAWVRVNGAVATLETNGSFRTTVALRSDENRIVVEAEDVHGNRAEETFTVIRQAAVAVADTKLHHLLDSGRWHTLVIGIGTYQHLPRLRTATVDAKAVAQMLDQDYGFRAELLLDGQATRKGIVDALNGLRRKLGPQDRLLVYYAGHGIFDKEADTAYWLPVDARDDSDTEWILASRITSSLRRLEAKSVLVVADSCYSGTLTRGVVADRRSKRDQFLSRLLTRSSRLLLASGGNEPVADGGGDGHSVFARALLNGLRRMEAPVFTVGELFQQQIRESVAGNSSQVPQLAVLRNSGHDGGGFVFRKR